MEQLKIGVKLRINHTVSPANSAKSVGSGLLDVYSTPSLIALMEKCSMELVQESLKEGQGTVGTLINIKHLKATKIGETVTAESRLREIDNKRLCFDVKVYEGDKLIGTGEHERYIIEEERFLNNI
jgi:fluoroacetyl-CoA thioesterase